LTIPVSVSMNGLPAPVTILLNNGTNTGSNVSVDLNLGKPDCIFDETGMSERASLAQQNLALTSQLLSLQNATFECQNNITQNNEMAINALNNLNQANLNIQALATEKNKLQTNLTDTTSKLTTTENERNIFLIVGIIGGVILTLVGDHYFMTKKEKKTNPS
jgi:hypothetical protein